MNRVSTAIQERYGLTKWEAEYIIKTAPLRYKEYPIKKTSGKGQRIIAQPTPQIKSLQRFVLKEFLSELPIHECAYAYVKDRSIKDNALAHKNPKYLLKMDFKSFFPSINEEDIRKHFKKYSNSNFDKSELDSLIHICLRKKAAEPFHYLSIGAPSSPFLSNTVMFDFDEIVSEFCTERGVTYTRYADDLTFSVGSKDILFEIERDIGEILKRIAYPKLFINYDKTVHTSKKRNRKITGLTVSNDGVVSIGRDRKRKIRAAIHAGVNGRLSADATKELQGQLGFLKFVDPIFFRSLEKKYSSKILHKFLSGNSSDP